MPTLNPFLFGGAQAQPQPQQRATLNPFYPPSGGQQGSIPELLAGLGLVALRNERPGSPLVGAAEQVFRNASQQREFQQQQQLEAQRLGNQRALQESNIQADFQLAGFNAGTADRRAEDEFRRRLELGRFETEQQKNIASFGETLPTSVAQRNALVNEQQRQDLLFPLQVRDKALDIQGRNQQLQQNAANFPLQQQETQLGIDTRRQQLDAFPQQQELNKRLAESEIAERHARTAAADPQTQLKNDLSRIEAETNAKIKLAQDTGQVELTRQQASAYEAESFKNYIDSTVGSALALTPTQRDNIFSGIQTRSFKQAIADVGDRYGPQGLITLPDGTQALNFEHAEAPKFLAAQQRKHMLEQAEKFGDPDLLSMARDLAKPLEDTQGTAPAPAPASVPISAGQVKVKDPSGGIRAVPRDFAIQNGLPIIP